jgi:hypothetical protein
MRKTTLVIALGLIAVTIVAAGFRNKQRTIFIDYPADLDRAPTDSFIKMIAIRQNDTVYLYHTDKYFIYSKPTK